MNAYRSEMYQNYVTAQFPGWARTDRRADDVWRKATLRRTRQWLPSNPNARCLDLGCGAGQLMLALRDAGYRQVSGVDLGPEAVAIARSQGLDVALTDCRAFLENSTDSFDLICAFDLLEHFRKDELLDLLRLIHKRLNPAGTLIFQTPNALSPWASHYRYGDFTHELLLCQRSAEAVLKLTGFQNVAVREVAPFIHGLTSAARAALWRTIWAACAVWNLAETGTLNGGIYTRNMIMRADKPL